jgi:hypothetical protein
MKVVYRLSLGMAVLFIFIRSYNVDTTEVPYPEGYRMWTHIKSGMVGPKSRMYNVLGGFFHVYANPLALKGLETGNFEDGAVFAFDRLEMNETESGDIVEGKCRLVDVMVRDSKKYESTGGWGYEEFAGDSKTNRTILTQATSKCFNCHAKQKGKSFVFSSFRK